MEKSIEYSFDESTGIFYKYYRGLINLDDIFSSWDHVIANQIIPANTKGIILDYSNASFDVYYKEYYKIAGYYKSHLEIFGGMRIAILTQSTNDVVIPTLVESLDEGYLSKPFYTLEAALRWVLM